MEITFDSVSGRVYAVEYNEALTSDPQTWTELTSGIPGDGSPLTIIDPDGSTNRKYPARVRFAP